MCAGREVSSVTQICRPSTLSPKRVSQRNSCKCKKDSQTPNPSTNWLLARPLQPGDASRTLSDPRRNISGYEGKTTSLLQRIAAPLKYQTTAKDRGSRGRNRIHVNYEEVLPDVLKPLNISSLFLCTLLYFSALVVMFCCMSHLNGFLLWPLSSLLYSVSLLFPAPPTHVLSISFQFCFLCTPFSIFLSFYFWIINILNTKKSISYHFPVHTRTAVNQLCYPS